MGQRDKDPPGLGFEEDRERRRLIASAAAMRLKTIAASLNMPVEAFSLPHSRVALPRVFTSREEEAAEVLRLYFAIDDVAVRLRFLELLRDLPTNRVRAEDEKV
ncbi:hypothetical protein MKK84_16230 [Methylobacterium sp. E-065]|uniref:hypothetical protein n=1 Tax=Methylobacterium sp. E-065 TaxID=2836583 RepID=UPI001FBA42C2|nr:hypothetical protein [Methylobacterium sp. E-065]MCJ2018972.1 hypothetical protein [Methylobacterium sp. E-065]